MLSKHSDTLTGKRKNLRIFLPLCGKAVDMKWLVNVSINSSMKITTKLFNVKNILNCSFIVLSFRSTSTTILAKIWKKAKLYLFTFSVYKTLLYVVERLADDGHDVVGLECAEKGCREFFEEQDMPYTTENLTECEGKVFKVRLIDWLINIPMRFLFYSKHQIYKDRVSMIR